MKRNCAICGKQFAEKELHYGHKESCPSYLIDIYGDGVKEICDCDVKWCKDCCPVCNVLRSANDEQMD
jgi:hypothetical protein